MIKAITESDQSLMVIIEPLAMVSEQYEYPKRVIWPRIRNIEYIRDLGTI